MVAFPLDVMRTVVVSDILLGGGVLAPPMALLKLEVFQIESVDGNEVVLEVGKSLSSQLN